MKRPKNYIEIHALIRGETTKDSTYVLTIVIGQREFSEDEDDEFYSRRSVCQIARNLSKTLDLPIYETDEDFDLVLFE